MRSLVIVPLVLAALLAIGGMICAHKRHHAVGVPAEIQEAFQTWKRQYGKLYKSPSEEAYRLSIFHKKYFVVLAKNSANRSYTVGLNKFADLTKEEFKIKYTGYKPVANVGEVDNSLLLKTPSNDADWRTKDGVVTPVKDQKQCGSCWAFSATGALEGSAQIFSKQAMSFSEQQLVDCSTKYGNDGCDGGLMNYAFKYVVDNGITTEEKYPYKGVDQKCASRAGDYKISGFSNVPVKSSQALASACDTQPISVAIEADEIMDYTSGIFDDRSCGDQLDHGVLLVGYTSDYWIVKNSWSDTWGEKGYIRFSRTAIPDKKGGMCGILTAASFPKK